MVNALCYVEQNDPQVQKPAHMTGAPSMPRKFWPGDRALLNYELRGGASLEFGIAYRFATSTWAAAALRARVSTHLPDLPDLTFTLDRPIHRFRRPQWTIGKPDLNWHIQDLTLCGSVSTTLENAMNERLPLDRPPWQLLLLSTGTDEQWVILRVNHALADALSVIEILRKILSDRSSAPAGIPEQALPLEYQLPTVMRLAPSLPTMIRRLTSFTGPAFSGFRTTNRRRMAWIDLDDQILRVVAARHAVTSNEVFLAALAGALREWPHTPWRNGARDVWAFVPCDLRTTSDPIEIGTPLGALRIRLPCAEEDPVRRLRLIAEASTAEKNYMKPAMFLAREYLPSWLARCLFAVALSPQQSDIMASHVTYRGPDLNGLVATTALGHFPRHRPLGALLVRDSGRLSMTITVDASLPSPKDLCRLWTDKLVELREIPV